jgi:hypothetical protein
MLTDAQNYFSNAQAVTATAISENVIDANHASNALKDLGCRGAPVYLRIQIDEAFATATSVTFTLESDSTANLATSATTHWSSGAIAIASLTAGAIVATVQLPEMGTYERYVGLRYTIGGSSATAGKVSAFLTGGAPTTKALYADASTNYTGR